MLADVNSARNGQKSGGDNCNEMFSVNNMLWALHSASDTRTRYIVIMSRLKNAVGHSQKSNWTCDCIVRGGWVTRCWRNECAKECKRRRVATFGYNYTLNGCSAHFQSDVFFVSRRHFKLLSTIKRLRRHKMGHTHTHWMDDGDRFQRIRIVRRKLPGLLHEMRITVQCYLGASSRKESFPRRWRRGSDWMAAPGQMTCNASNENASNNSIIRPSLALKGVDLFDEMRHFGQFWFTSNVFFVVVFSAVKLKMVDFSAKIAARYQQELVCSFQSSVDMLIAKYGSRATECQAAKDISGHFVTYKQ